MIRIALTGSHGVAKTYIIDKLYDLAQEDGWEVRTITSPTRYVKSLGFTNNHQLTADTEFLCQALRIIRQCEAEKELAKIKESPTLILADRCMLDELSYTREAMDRLRGPNWVVPLEVVEREGVEGIEKRDPAVALAKYYSVSYEMSYRNVLGFWDRVYYKAPHPDYLPEEDADRLSELMYQLDVDKWIRTHWTMLDIEDQHRELAQKAELDRDEAVDQIWADIQELAKGVSR